MGWCWIRRDRSISYHEISKGKINIIFVINFHRDWLLRLVLATLDSLERLTELKLITILQRELQKEEMKKLLKVKKNLQILNQEVLVSTNMFTGLQVTSLISGLNYLTYCQLILRLQDKSKSYSLVIWIDPFLQIHTSLVKRSII